MTARIGHCVAEKFGARKKGEKHLKQQVELILVSIHLLFIVIR
jgi:hypothetical protein